MYFIGVTTGQSSIMKVFPLWAKELGLTDAVMKGIDIAIHADAAVYRKVVEWIRDDPLSLGALVTTHKIDLYQAASDLFDYLDPHAVRFGELSSISKRDGRLRGHAQGRERSQEVLIGSASLTTRRGTTTCCSFRHRRLSLLFFTEVPQRRSAENNHDKNGLVRPRSLQRLRSWLLWRHVALRGLHILLSAHAQL